LDPDGRELDRLRAFTPKQVGQSGRLRLSASDEDAPSGEGADFT
jgi:hypothetical protein